jgi:hypothetical protein
MSYIRTVGRDDMAAIEVLCDRLPKANGVAKADGLDRTLAPPPFLLAS